MSTHKNKNSVSSVLCSRSLIYISHGLVSFSYLHFSEGRREFPPFLGLVTCFVLELPFITDFILYTIIRREINTSD